jgi:acetylornithine deacetylase
MARTVRPPEEMLAFLRQWVGDRASIEAGAAVPPVRLRTLPGFETSVVSFATDVPVLSRWGEPYLFGPGSVHVAHTDGEYIDTSELKRAVGSYVRLVKQALERGEHGSSNR